MSVDEALLSGDRFTLSRFLTQVENDDPQVRAVLDRLYAHTGHAQRIGITGAPGTGKSSLVNLLAHNLRATRAKTVAVIAVDPSSPFSGGALLGDRVRMHDLAGDAGIFIRSMASRGALGGLALTTARMVEVFDAAGFDVILIETVGAGQAEVDITRLAHTTLVVEAPGFGDDIQAIKAGIMEIADILIVNKADLPGAESTERALRSNLEIGYSETVNRKSGHQSAIDRVPNQPEEGWIPPILRTVATAQEGGSEVWEAIEAHYAYLQRSGKLKQMERARLQKELNDLVQARLVDTWREKSGTLKMEEALQQVIERHWSPEQAADWLMD